MVRVIVRLFEDLMPWLRPDGFRELPFKRVETSTWEPWELGRPRSWSELDQTRKLVIFPAYVISLLRDPSLHEVGSHSFGDMP